MLGIRRRCGGDEEKSSILYLSIFFLFSFVQVIN